MLYNNNKRPSLPGSCSAHQGSGGISTKAKNVKYSQGESGFRLNKWNNIRIGRLNDMRRLERAVNTMLSWMSGVTLRDRKCTAELMDCLVVVSVEEVVCRGRLRLYGHVERKDMKDRVSACRELQT